MHFGLEITLIKMKIEQINISEIKPYKNNPRKNDQAVKVVKRSIKEFGFRNPMLLDKKNEIIAGHTRLKAAIELGYKKVPYITIDDLTPAQIKAFRIMDNKSSENAEWDFDLLKEEFTELDDVEFDLELTGFELREVGDILDESFEEPVENVKQLGSHLIECPKCKHKFKREKK